MVGMPRISCFSRGAEPGIIIMLTMLIMMLSLLMIMLMIPTIRLICMPS